VGLPLAITAAENGFKVIYSGEGADEILFGYDIFFENRIRNFWKKYPNSSFRPALLKKLYQYLPQFKNSRYFSIIKDFYKSTLISDSQFYSHLSRWAQFRHVSSFFKMDNFENIEESLLFDLKESLPENYKDLGTDDKAQYLEINTLLSNYLLSSQGDRVSMANSVEGRYPFLDEDFVKSACSFGSKNLAPGLISKEYFRKSFADILPKKILNRPKIAYQAPEAKSFVDERFTSTIVSEFQDNFNNLDFINKKNFTNLIQKFKDPLSSKRIGFRENMAFIIGLSYFALKKSMLKWQNDK
jgi:asparagine synthase (glutamine-hydrolysing)